MECTDGGAIRCAETQVASALGNKGSGLLGDRKLNTGRAGRMAVIGALPVAKIDDAHQPQRPQSGIVKPAAALDVADPQGDVIQHGKFPQHRSPMYGKNGVDVTVRSRTALKY